MDRIARRRLDRDGFGRPKSSAFTRPSAASLMLAGVRRSERVRNPARDLESRIEQQRPLADALSAATPSGSTLIATSRFSLVSLARHTTPPHTADSVQPKDSGARLHPDSKMKTMGLLIVVAEYDEPGQLAGPLVQNGFRTETVDTADAALRFCGINPVTLVISRIVFRYGITGVELIDRLQALAAPPRALLVTSHPSDRLRKIPGFPPPGVPVLRKPVMTAELLTHVTSLAAYS